MVCYCTKGGGPPPSTGSPTPTVAPSSDVPITLIHKSCYCLRGDGTLRPALRSPSRTTHCSKPAHMTRSNACSVRATRVWPMLTSRQDAKLPAKCMFQQPGVITASLRDPTPAHAPQMYPRHRGCNSDGASGSRLSRKGRPPPGCLAHVGGLGW